MLFMLILFVISGLLIIGLAVPLILRKVPPNIWYGFRLPSTVNNPEIWYPANEYSAWRILWMGVSVIVAGIVGFAIPGMTAETYGLSIVVVIITGLIITLTQSLLYLRRLKQSWRG